MAALRNYESYRIQEKDSNKYYKSIVRKNEHYCTQENINQRYLKSQIRQDSDYYQKELERNKISRQTQRQDYRIRKRHNDEVKIAMKKARLHKDSGPKVRELEKEKKRIMRMNDKLKYNAVFSLKIGKKAKCGDEKSKLYHHVLEKQRESTKTCICCIRKLYDGITKLTAYKKEIIDNKNLKAYAYNFKQSEFIFNQCWNSLRVGIVPKRAGTKNLSFPDISECLKRLSPLGVRLVSPCLPFLQIISLQQYTANPQLSLKRNIVNIQVDVGEMMKCLPRLPEEAQVIQIVLKRKMEYKSSYMAEAIIVNDVKNSWEFLENSTLYKRYGIKENEEFFTQLTQGTFSFIVDEKDREYLSHPENELFGKFFDDDVNDNDNNDYNVNFDNDDILIIDQNREMADLTRIIAPGENKAPKPMYDIPYYENICNPHLFGGEPFDELKFLSANERHKLWLTHNDPRCRHDPSFVLLLGQMTVQKRTRDSMNFVTRRGCKNEALNAGKVLEGTLVDEIINLNEAYECLTPIVGSPAYLEDKKKILIAKIAQIDTPHIFLTFSLKIEENPYLLRKLYEEAYNKTISLQNVLDLKEKALLIRNNPVTCARYIHRYFSTIIECLKKINGPFGKFNYVDDMVQKDEVQQKGNLHRHMVCWLKDAPRFNPEDSKSEKRCVEFIDTFMTCRLDKNNPYVMGYQIHKHTFTCYKGAKNLKACRFHYPLRPMPKTRILSKLPVVERNEIVKFNFEKIKNYLDELSKLPRDIPFPQILLELQMSETDYIQAARYFLNTIRVFLKRESSEIFVNGYNIDILNLLKLNMDIQFICDAYACVNYLTDYVVKVQKDMAKLLRDLIEQFAQEDFTNLDKVKKFANVFINSRVLAAQEAAFLVLHLPFFKSSRVGIFIPTLPIEERSRVVKRKKQLSELPPESTDIYQDNIIDKYCNRNEQYLSMCLADFATGFSDPNKLQKNEDVNENNSDLENENENNIFDNDNHLENEKNDVKERTKRKILRTRHYNKFQDPANYYREQLLLFLPFTDEKTEIQDADHQKVYNKNEDLIKTHRKSIYQMD